MSSAVKAGGAAALATAAPRLRQTRRGPFLDERLLEFGNGGENMKDQPPARRRRVEMLGQRHQPDIPGLQILGRHDQLFERTGQPVELPHNQRIASTQHIVEDAFQLGPVARSPDAFSP
jgi:hypothetical protein